ncbi:MFS transporter, ACS family, allantoate permease, partial [Phenoliferia sp. Uapishka_3]
MLIPPSQSASSLLRSSFTAPHFKSGSASLDSLFSPSTPHSQSGLALGNQLEIMGPPGIGKSRTALAFVIEARFADLRNEVLLLDAEGSLSPELIHETAVLFASHHSHPPSSPRQVCSGIHYQRVCDVSLFIAFFHTLEEWLGAHPRVKLIVIDSLTAHVRPSLYDYQTRSMLLNLIKSTLQSITSLSSISVILTTQLSLKLFDPSSGLPTHFSSSAEALLVPPLGDTWIGGGRCWRVVLFYNKENNREGRRASLISGPEPPREKEVGFAMDDLSACFLLGKHSAATNQASQYPFQSMQLPRQQTPLLHLFPLEQIIKQAKYSATPSPFSSSPPTTKIVSNFISLLEPAKLRCAPPDYPPQRTAKERDTWRRVRNSFREGFGKLSLTRLRTLRNFLPNAILPSLDDDDPIKLYLLHPSERRLASLTIRLNKISLLLHSLNNLIRQSNAHFLRLALEKHNLRLWALEVVRTTNDSKPRAPINLVAILILLRARLKRSNQRANLDRLLQFELDISTSRLDLQFVVFSLGGSAPKTDYRNTNRTGSLGGIVVRISSQKYVTGGAEHDTRRSGLSLDWDHTGATSGDLLGFLLRPRRNTITGINSAEGLIYCEYAAWQAPIGRIHCVNRGAAKRSASSPTSTSPGHQVISKSSPRKLREEIKNVVSTLLIDLLSFVPNNLYPLPPMSNGSIDDDKKEALPSAAEVHSVISRGVQEHHIAKEEKELDAGAAIASGVALTPEENKRIRRKIDKFLMNGSAQMISGLLAYGVHHINSTHIQDWQVLFLLTGAITFVIGVAWWFVFPDNSATAWFLSPEERGMAVERIRQNQAGTENKTFKKHQFWEALTDVKIWLFFFFSLLDNIPNSLTNQASTIYTELGFSSLTSTLLGIPSGVIEIVTIASGIYLLGKFPNSRSILGMLYFIPNVLGAVLVIALPFSNKHGILGALYITGFGTTGFVIALAWLQASVSGHTKRTTAQAINLVGYCIGNIIGPQVWQSKFAPQNHVPWTIVIISYCICPIILFAIRTLHIRENARRDALAAAAKDDGSEAEVELIDVHHADGTTTVEKLDRAFMDLTDKENQQFRYV